MDVMPRNIASFGGAIDDLTVLITIITAVCLILAEAFILVSAIRFRRSAHPNSSYVTGARWKEARWVLIPVLLVVFLDFYIDVRNHDAWVEIKETLPSDAQAVGCVAEQFLWTFMYPGPDGELGTSDDVAHGELHVPVKTNIIFYLQAKDVLHSLWIPQLRLKQDALPGRTIKGWFRAEEEGTYDVACAEICGDGHSKMAAKLVVQSEADYRDWLSKAQSGQSPTDPVELMKAKGCLGCHSLDGAKTLGPSYKGLFGRQETVVTGGVERQITVDEQYLRKSILEPKADVVKGFPPAMPDMRGKLSDQDVDRIVEFLKTVK